MALCYLYFEERCLYCDHSVLLAVIGEFALHKRLRRGVLADVAFADEVKHCVMVWHFQVLTAFEYMLAIKTNSSRKEHNKMIDTLFNY